MRLLTLKGRDFLGASSVKSIAKRTNQRGSDWLAEPSRIHERLSRQLEPPQGNWTLVGANPVGRRYERGNLGSQETLPANLLIRHVAIIAGSGSGKPSYCEG